MTKLRICNLSLIAGALLLSAVSRSAQNSAEQSNASPEVLFELLALNRDIPTTQDPIYLSPIDIVPSPDSQYLYVAEMTAKQIAVVSRESKTLLKTIKLPSEVTGIAVAPGGAYLYATCSSPLWPAGLVCEVDISAGRVLRRFPAGHSARAPVLSPDGKILYVCNVFNNDVSVFDVASGKETARIAVTREPYSAGITPDGSVLVVANSLPNGVSTDTLHITSKVTLISTATNKVTDTIHLPRGSHSAFGLTISPDGKFAFVTHLVAMFTIPSTIIESGWIHTNNCAIIDIKAGKLLNDVTLDRATMGSANPWGVACTKDGSILSIVHSGSNELSVIDLKEMLIKASSGKELSRDFLALYTIRQKVPVKGKAPRALAIVGNKAYTAGYFESTIEVFDLSLTATTASATIALGDPQPLTPTRKGEFHFYDASICYEKWQSCHSCHPFTRPDALNWILNSPTSAPKNAKSMLHAWWTAPMSWAGKRPAAGGLDGSIRMGISTELFIQPQEEVAVPMDAFFMRLKPVPSPHLVKGRLSESALRGKAIFSKVACDFCHPAPLFTSKKFHNCGVEDPWDANTQWDDPSLIEAWRTGPYNHIGSHETIEEIILLKGHSMEASKLSPQELKDLVEYTLSL